MLNIKQGNDALVRLERKVKDAVVVPAGACVVIDSNREVALTGADASAIDFVCWAYNCANVPGEDNSAFKSTGAITLLAPSIFIGETDQYDTGGTYVEGTKLASEAGKLIPAATGDRVIARALGAPVDGILEFITVPLQAVA